MWFNISLETTQGAWGKPGRGHRSLRGESIVSPGTEESQRDPTAPPTHRHTPNFTQDHRLHPFPLRPQTPTPAILVGAARNQFGKERLFNQVEMHFP